MSHHSFIEKNRQLIADFSATQDVPFYAYDIDGLATHIKQLVNDDIKLWFAVKANPLSSVIKTLANQGMQFDVASSGELDQVLAQGVKPEHILNTGPAKSLAQITHFFEQGVSVFVAESANQLALINQQAKVFNVVPSILLRVQLRFEQDSDNPLGGNELTPFGLGSDEWNDVDLSQFDQINVIGLHIFQWGNMLEADALIDLWQAMVSPLKALAMAMGFELSVLDLGGGLGVPYEGDERRLDWETLKQALIKIKTQAGVDELWLELGRFAVAEYGYYINRVVDVKNNYQQDLVVMQGGINHLLRPAITSQPFPTCLLRNSSASALPFHIHGPLCTSLDKLGTLSLPSDVQIDDILIFSQCGAYGFTESMPFFLCHELPAEVIVIDGDVETIRPALPASSYLF